MAHEKEYVVLMHSPDETFVIGVGNAVALGKKLAPVLDRVPTYIRKRISTCPELFPRKKRIEPKWFRFDNLYSTVIVLYAEDWPHLKLVG